MHVTPWKHRKTLWATFFRVCNQTTTWITKLPFCIYQVVQKLLHMGCLKWGPPEQCLVVPSENTDFPKKLCNMKVFSIRFMTKKVILIFSVRWLLIPTCLLREESNKNCTTLACNKDRV